MKITNLIKKDTIILDLKSIKKEDILEELIDKLDKSNRLNDREEFKRYILKREADGTTGIGGGIAIPHAKTKAVKTPSIVFGRSKNGVDFDSLDGKATKLFFMIAASEGANKEHLETLSKLATYLMDKNFLKELLDANSEVDVIKIIKDKEIEQDNKTSKKDVSNDFKNERILAVTACATGIAHTYIAADLLNQKADEMGVYIKVETNGSTGVKNILTEEDIKRAKAIIISADTKVAMDRFAGKKIIQTKVSEAIKNPETLIKKVLDGGGTVYKGSEDISSIGEISGESIYTNLMNGVSNMLPFVVGGGILIALSLLFDFNNAGAQNYGFGNSVAAFLNTLGSTAFSFMLPVLAGYIAFAIGDRPALAPGFIGGALSSNGDAGFLGALIAGFLAGYIMVGLKKVFSKLPNSLEGIKPVLIFPLFGILTVGILMNFVIIPPVEALNTGINTFLNTLAGANKVLLGVVLGGMMAADMGGPINKGAYVFGVASVAEGSGHIMAAVMAGGMVPPLGIAIATTFFKEKFTKTEIDAGKVNYIMGLSFITEGAIPFAAADPRSVIPSVIVGSAIAGGLSELFGASSPAPHGGIFVIPIISNGLLYLIFNIYIDRIYSYSYFIEGIKKGHKDEIDLIIRFKYCIILKFGYRIIGRDVDEKDKCDEDIGY